MRDLATLAYADWRAARHEIARIVRSPGRLTLWMLFGLFVVSTMVSRGFVYHGSASSQADMRRADLFVCSIVVLLALGLAGFSSPHGIFRTRVEGRFVIGSPVSAPVAIAYLQTRESLAVAARFLYASVYMLVLVGPHSLGVVGLLADVVFLFALVAAGTAIVVPRSLLPPFPAACCKLVGGIVIATMLVTIARDLVDSVPFVPEVAAAFVRGAVPAWHPGTVLLAPSLWYALAALAVAAAAGGLLAALGRDAYPELYALSVARIDRAQIVRSSLRAAVRTRAAARASAHRTAPLAREPAATRARFLTGALAFVWKALHVVARRVSLWVVAVVVVGAFGAGFGFARVCAVDPEAFSFAVVFAPTVLLIAAAGVGSHLADEVRRPLFWLSSATMFDRLSALLLARNWAGATIGVLAGVGFACGGGRGIEVASIAVGFPALLGLLTALGFALFTFFPRASDRRGPLAAARLVLMGILAIPPIVIGFFVAGVLAMPPAGFGAALFAVLIEAGALVGLAAWRLDGRLDRLTT